MIVRTGVLLFVGCRAFCCRRAPPWKQSNLLVVDACSCQGGQASAREHPHVPHDPSAHGLVMAKPYSLVARPCPNRRWSYARVFNTSLRSCDRSGPAFTYLGAAHVPLGRPSGASGSGMGAPRAPLASRSGAVGAPLGARPRRGGSAPSASETMRGTRMLRPPTPSSTASPRTHPLGHSSRVIEKRTDQPGTEGPSKIDEAGSKLDADTPDIPTSPAPAPAVFLAAIRRRFQKRGNESEESRAEQSRTVPNAAVAPLRRRSHVAQAPLVRRSCAAWAPHGRRSENGVERVGAVRSARNDAFAYAWRGLERGRVRLGPLRRRALGLRRRHQGRRVQAGGSRRHR